ncbi:MAG: adenosylcobinamide-GDP ribazoletransferase [Fusobacteriaceae bacterium]
MKGLVQLFKFMTRLPIYDKGEFNSEELGKSMKFFPIVGIIIGIIMYSIQSLLSLYINSSILISILVVITYVVLTGGLHLDGLSDTFDGIFSYRSKQKMLEIMKDSRIGANGAIAITLYFITNIILLSELETIEVPMGAFILIYPVIGRMCSVVNCATAQYAKSSGMAKSFVDSTNINDLLISLVITVGYAYFILNYFDLTLNYLLLIPIIGILGYYFARLMTKKIGGITGDTLGAVVELSQIITLLLIYFIK